MHITYIVTLYLNFGGTLFEGLGPQFCIVTQVSLLRQYGTRSKSHSIYCKLSSLEDDCKVQIDNKKTIRVVDLSTRNLPSSKSVTTGPLDFNTLDRLGPHIHTTPHVEVSQLVSIQDKAVVSGK